MPETVSSLAPVGRWLAFCTSGTGERDGAFAMSLQVRKRIEQGVCWIKTISGLRKPPLVALPTVRGWVTWTCAA